MCEQPTKIEVSPPSCDDHEKNCPCFTVFIGVLLKYLKNQGDLEAYSAVQKRIHDTSYYSATNPLIVAKLVLRDIPKIVKPSDLRRVRSYLHLRVQQKKRLQNKEPSKEATTTTGVRCNVFGIVHRVSP